MAEVTKAIFHKLKRVEFARLNKAQLIIRSLGKLAIMLLQKLDSASLGLGKLRARTGLALVDAMTPKWLKTSSGSAQEYCFGLRLQLASFNERQPNCTVGKPVI